MTEVISRRQGFPVSIGKKNVLLSSKVNQRLICQICKCMLLEPIQTTRGELACKLCYTGLQKRKPGYCPIDKEPIEDNEIFPDRCTRMEINKLQCICSNEKHGCGWIGALNDINAHEDKCEYVEDICEDCKQIIIRCKRNQHLAKECFKRKVECCYCKEIFTGYENQLHEVKCLQRPNECIFNCGSKITNLEIYEHMSVCQKIISKEICPYSVFGCSYKSGDGESFSKHMKISTSDHRAIVIAKLVMLQGERENLLRQIEIERKMRLDMEKRVEENENKHIDIREKHQTLEREVIELKSSIIEFNELKGILENRIIFLEEAIINNKKIEKIISAQKEFDKVLKNKDFHPLMKNIDNINSLLNDIEECKGRISLIETSHATATSNLADIDLKFQLLENTSYGGKQIWKIDNFTLRMQQATSGQIVALHNAPCFTERFGYKFCTRLYLNGDGVGKNKYLSIFFVILKSQHDSLLTWPFKKRITFRLLNTEDLSKTKKETFMSDSNSTSFQKPTKDMNIAAGCPMFIEKNILMQEGFVNDDCLFIETKVE